MSQAKTIIGLSLPADLGRLAGLPFPDEVDTQPRSENAALKIAEAAHALWLELIIDPEQARAMRAKVKSPHTGDTLVAKGVDLWELAVLKASAYYDHALRILLAGERFPSWSESPPGFAWDIPFAVLLEEGGTKATPRAFKTERTYLSAHIARAYVLGMMSASFTRAATRGASFYGIALDSVGSLESLVAASKSKTQETYARRLNLSLIQYLRECHAADADLENIEHRPGAFSAMRLNELSLLARRDKTVADRYGLKRIESIFEHRLALVFQSFGFYVVSTRKGKSTVDLYCVSPSPKGGYSFMVEAKTSKRAYSLSPRDSRAIAQYVTDAESGLTTLPPLKFVLLLAH